MGQVRAIAPEDVGAFFIYDPEEGVLRWRVQTSSRALAGTRAGTTDVRGYIQVQLRGVRYMAHRLVWALTYGVWPNGEIDHKNGRPSDNRLSNLRDVSPSENKQNSRQAHADSATGLLGVTYDKRKAKFMAQICVKGSNKFLGYFDTAETAHRAYVSAKRQVHVGGLL